MVLVDTSVLLDIVTDDRRWVEWSTSAIATAASQDQLAINEVIYAELSVGYERIEDLDGMIATLGLSLARIPVGALFLAGKAFRHYRKTSGTKTGVLPDFFVGAHAAAVGAVLITRDVRNVRRYFPDVRLIAPHT
jgi:predicted nucleic acid-binding protein